MTGTPWCSLSILSRARSLARRLDGVRKSGSAFGWREIESPTEILVGKAFGELNLAEVDICAVVEFHQSVPPLYRQMAKRDSMVSSSGSTCSAS